MSALLSLLIFSVIHLATPAFRFLSHLPRRAWLSFGGGTSIAYVTLDLLPRTEQAFTSVNHYVIITAGLVVFYGLELYAQRHANEDKKKHINKTHRAVHAATFLVYSFIIGYLTSTLAAGRELLLFTVALGIHFTVVDYALWEHYPTMYRRQARWVSVAVLWLGFALGAAALLPPFYANVFLAFLTGGILLNTLKEELPKDKQSRFGYFLAGVVVYAVVVLVV